MTGLHYGAETPQIDGYSGPVIAPILSVRPSRRVFDFGHLGYCDLSLWLASIRRGWHLESLVIF